MSGLTLPQTTANLSPAPVDPEPQGMKNALAQQFELAAELISLNLQKLENSANEMKSQVYDLTVKAQQLRAGESVTFSPAPFTKKRALVEASGGGDNDKKKKKKKKDPNKPTKSPSAYNLYVKDHATAARAEIIAGDQLNTPTDETPTVQKRVMKLLAVRWANVSEKEKAELNIRVEEDKSLYDEALKEYIEAKQAAGDDVPVPRPKKVKKQPSEQQQAAVAPAAAVAEAVSSSSSSAAPTANNKFVSASV